ncbi:MAG: outer membrane lipoprotein-sorting protein [Gammaproteobacteria bacterium]|nr:outer membrane lipoprotein-sorting protein [Gammaproteobacteria bacterium]
MKYLWLKLFLILLWSLLNTAAMGASDEAILRYADTARGGGFSGLKWLVTVESKLAGGGTEQFKLEVSVTAGDWLAEFKHPRNVLGNKLLQLGNNMWFSKKGLRKPVPISQRQRLTGSAANGDIASTNYAEDYQATRLADETIGGTLSYVFDLKAKTTSTTYDRIKYWVDQKTGLGVQANFYTSAGRLLKSATFHYGNTILQQEKLKPFISQMVIRDEINPSRSSVLEYDDIEVKSIPAAKLRL